MAVEILGYVGDTPVFDPFLAKVARDFFDPEKVRFGTDALVDSGP